MNRLQILALLYLFRFISASFSFLGGFAMSQPIFKHIRLNHLPDHDLQGIGLVAMAWSYLEGTIERICWLASRVPSMERGQAFTTHMTFRSRYQAAVALLKLDFADSTPAAVVAGLENRLCGELAGRRNNIVHSRIHKFPDFTVTLRKTYKARGVIKQQTEWVDPNEYNNLTNEILTETNVLIDQLNVLGDLVEAKDGELPPWCEKFRQINSRER